MKKIFATLVVVLTLWTSVKGQEVEDETEFGYIRGSDKGPEKWGSIHPEWAACNNGKTQSPIDLFHPRVQINPNTHKIDFFYRPANATMKNRGHDIEVKWEEETSKIVLNGTEYVLRQCHWHTPSEHTIGGKRFDMELHLVHQNPDDKSKIAVIGLLYRLGKPDKFLSKLTEQLRKADNNTEEIDVGIINPKQIVKGRGKKYFRYMGSLTTPPCTEGVIWTIHRKIGRVSHEQLQLIHRAVHDHAVQNARPQQARNGRMIRLFKSTKSAFN